VNASDEIGYDQLLIVYTQYGNESTTGTWVDGGQTYKDGFGKPWVLVHQCQSVIIIIITWYF